MIEKLNLEEPTLSKYAVNDNAANAKKAIRESVYLKQYLCDNHTLQLRGERILQIHTLIGQEV